MPSILTNNSFLGGTIGQTNLAISSFEQLLRPIDFARIVEFGTWNGNFSIYLALWCLRRNADFYTYDIINWKKATDSFNNNRESSANFLSQFLDGHFEPGNVLEEPLKTKIASLISSDGCTVLFCDNGNKKLEFNLYAPYLKPGDIIIVHDWKKEINPPDIEGICIACNIKEIHKDLSAEEGWLGFFQKGE